MERLVGASYLAFFAAFFAAAFFFTALTAFFAAPGVNLRDFVAAALTFRAAMLQSSC